MKRINKKGQLVIDAEDIQVFRAALGAYEMALIQQKGLAESPQVIKDFVLKKVDEVQRAEQKYFPNPNKVVITTSGSGGSFNFL